MEAPKFNLSNSMLKEDEFNEKIANASKGRGFEPGNYNVKITDIGFHKNKETGSISCPGDSSWFNIIVTFTGADGRSKNQYFQVPTKSPFYKKDGKESVFNFTKLQEFLAGMGVYMDYHNYAQLIPRVFGSEAALKQLIGEELTIDIGYTGPYIKYVEQGKFHLVINGKPFALDGVEKVFPDRDAAELYAKVELAKKKVAKSSEITKIHSKPARTEAKTASESW